jgi:hypothetical protein
LDLLPPNLLAIQPTAAAPAAARIFDQPAPQIRQLDFQFPNISALSAGQAQVHPVGAAVDEAVPRPPPHQLDFQFPNVALLGFAQLQVKPIGAVLDETAPQPPPRSLDFAFPNVVLDVAQIKPPFAPIFDRPVVARPPADVLFPNLLTTTLVVTTRPVTPPLFSDRPAPQQRPQDFVPPNVALLSLAQSRIKPVGALLDETIPSPQVRQVDFLFPNRIVLTTPPPTPPPAQPFFADRPALQPLPQDFQFPNLVLTEEEESLRWRAILAQVSPGAVLLRHPPDWVRREIEYEDEIAMIIASSF